ncbi:hypothetical protein H310_01783 [Aphanomyces invadans]|uniref:PH domain-containing protein n=1 Tax=Aphanomyces invadans TaxID=157072 RepID=A0A024ULG7_9STRA|nr:hypothetical protein H310_01783 [Aphanomyces invadans]ETW07154.1 hypothetical protein H310_01783 [Aphanomyces invadans]|eukprot:XP_008863247.1 hypothetical protein H310_01783 [Aphanomyces invadans]
MLIKTGNLFKQGGGRPGRFQRKNWKPRCFKLTTEALDYYDYKSGQLKGTIDLTACLGPQAIEVMPTDCARKSLFSTTPMWRMAIQTRTRRWFLAADTEAILVEWADALVMVLGKLQLRQTTPPLSPSAAASRDIAVTQPCA